MNNGCKLDYKKKYNNIKVSIFFILISLTLLQQMPIIKDLYYNQIRVILYIAFGLFSMNSFRSIGKHFKIPLVRYFILLILYTIILFIILKIFGGNSIKIFDMVVPFGILLCSLDTKINEKQLNAMIMWYIMFSMILGISSIFYYGEGFQITQRYFLEFKNQIGPILGSSAIISAIWILDKKQIDSNRNYILLKSIIFCGLVASIIVIRNRAGLVAIMITMIFFIIKEYRIKFNKKNILFIKGIFLVFIVLCILGVFDGVINSIWKSFTFNYDVSDINSISAGRFDTYKMCIEFLKQYPILGEITAGNIIEYTPHNYILNQMVKFGIVGSLPLIMIYIYILYFVVKELRIKKEKDKFSMPLWIMVFSLIVSLFEYTYPYGPGVSQIFVWFLIGQYYRKYKY